MQSFKVHIQKLYPDIATLSNVDSTTYVLMKRNILKKEIRRPRAESLKIKIPEDQIRTFGIRLKIFTPLKSDSHLPKTFCYLLDESPLKMIKNSFYFILKALFVLKIFKILSRLFGHARKTA